MSALEPDLGGRSASFESKVREIHSWLSATEAKFITPVLIGDPEEMEKAAQQQAVSDPFYLVSFPPFLKPSVSYPFSIFLKVTDKSLNVSKIEIW